MKKITLLALLFLGLGIFVSCSEDSIDFNQPEEETAFAFRNSSMWTGVIGIDKGADGYLLTADERTILDDFEEILATQGYITELKHATIVAKKAVNDPNHEGIMLVGSDDAGISIGVWLSLDQRNLILENVTEAVSTTCTGCATGCNLQYLTSGGKKWAYCNENGCMYNCTKSETKFSSFIMQEEEEGGL